MIQLCRHRLLMSAVVVSLAICADSLADAPTPTDPGGLAMGLLPGTFPTTVTAANVNIEQFTPASLDGSNSNNLRLSFPAAGPIKWSESRHNEGDIELLIGPGNPTDPDYFPPTTFVSSYQPLDGQPFAKTTIAWRVNQRTGAALATVRHNGVDRGNDFTYNGSPVGTIHGIAYFNQTLARGWGYRMSDGVFENGDQGSTSLQIGLAGFDDNRGESSTNAAAAYFPYEQGWIGAWVNSGSDGEATFASSSPGLPTSSVNYSGTVATVQLPSVDSATDGMLFVAPTHDDNRTNIAAAFPNAGGWTVSVREDDNAIFSGDATSLVPGGENQFQFLYVPYSAARLVGGHVQGSDASLINSAGSDLFDITRNAAGDYAVSVYASPGGSKLKENDGMLILSVAGSMAGQPTLADRAFMSYEYDSGSGDFIVQSRRLTEISSANSENQFGDWLQLQDANFYLAWVSFTNPLAPSLDGDFNEDGSVDAADYVIWRKSIGTPEAYDAWRANFGATAGSGSGGGASLAAGSVPEPSSLALGGLLIGLTMAGRVRSRSGA